MDNPIFRVNGKGDEMLLDALTLAFRQHGLNATASGWTQTEEHGLILLWSDTSKGSTSFPASMSAPNILPTVKLWLESDFAKRVTLDGGTQKYRDSDVDNDRGWLIYKEGWGHVGSEHYAICGIKPAWLWYGK